ncbi:MAG: hypothetical protein LBV16_05400 [Elusimicrobiota bacterium]|jgi:hypothetical protein|nr:hypothetical protein [Elusimicrobiota bacterium]
MKNFQIASILKIFVVILAIFTVIIGTIYTLFLKAQFGDVLPMSQIVAITAGIVILYFALSIVAVLIVAALYNALSPKLGGVVVELEAKE